MKNRYALAALVAASLATAAAAQGGPGMGPGMMGGPGMGRGMMGAECPMGGPGMGPGRMGGHGMGYGRMGGPGHGWQQGDRLRKLEALNLSDDQRQKITEIRRETQRKMHGLMGSLREVRWKSQDLAHSPHLDAAAARKLYEEGAAVRKQMFEARLEAWTKAEALLSPAQREQLHKAPKSRG